ncbi:ketopantoate reductase family protein [Alicyclobacillus dauci]|uniref:2-dehydropantoate 2-reductase n=1 Tax=Alicyclobacillus dauci TaxID=1475485 RepID=A0ABY6Z3P3_9BACL|nr:ketopantoate reductase family protein [Alicyclobacillus dauci]WAH36951.1 ketopantoate reductase family protein [Alicyclobacillus dauci]
MKRIENVSLIGLGAIGAAYASRLHDMDPDCIQIIADENRMRRLQGREVLVNGRGYEFRYISPNVDTRPADLVIVAVKYEGLELAIEQIKRHVGPDTIILPLLNGISSEEAIGSVYGHDKVLHAMCVAIDAVREDTSIRFSSIGRICFGELQNVHYSENVQRVKELFDRANIPYAIPEDMQRTMWWKFMVNVGVNQTSAVLKAPYGVFQNLQDARELMISAMREVIMLSQKVGVNLTEEDIETFMGILNGMSPEGKTSMLQDIEAGRKTEVEYLAGKVCELGRQHCVPTPTNDMLYKIIRTMEQMNSMR